MKHAGLIRIRSNSSGEKKHLSQMLENVLKKIVVLVQRNPCIDREIDELHIQKS